MVASTARRLAITKQLTSLVWHLVVSLGSEWSQLLTSVLYELRFFVSHVEPSDYEKLQIFSSYSKNNWIWRFEILHIDRASYGVTVTGRVLSSASGWLKSSLQTWSSLYLWLAMSWSWFLVLGLAPNCCCCCCCCCCCSLMLLCFIYYFILGTHLAPEKVLEAWWCSNDAATSNSTKDSIIMMLSQRCRQVRQLKKRQSQTDRGRNFLTNFPASELSNVNSLRSSYWVPVLSDWPLYNDTSLSEQTAQPGAVGLHPHFIHINSYAKLSSSERKCW